MATTENCEICGKSTVSGGYVYGVCNACARRAILAYKRNRAKREQNAILRELCGTSARAAREDMGL